MIGFFKVKSFTGTKDAANTETQIKVVSELDNNIEATLYLPPYLRKTQSNISVDSTVFGVLDDVTGLGCALFGQDSADFQYFFDADVFIKKELTVKNDIKSQSGDVIYHVLKDD